MWKRTDGINWVEYNIISMKRNESQKKENDSEKGWYARMDAIEALWRTKMAESRREYQGNFIQMTKKRLGSEFSGDNV